MKLSTARLVALLLLLCALGVANKALAGKGHSGGEAQNQANTNAVYTYLKQQVPVPAQSSVQPSNPNNINPNG